MYKDGEIVTIMKDPEDKRFKKYDEVVIIHYFRSSNQFKVRLIGGEETMLIPVHDVKKR